MCPTDLSIRYRAKVADVQPKAASPDILSESVLLRLLVGVLWIIFAIFICVLMSFHEPLRPSTVEVLLALILVGLVIGLPL
jgi:RsiW-degrading membrane proteinase PrsW (M82 family)